MYAARRRQQTCVHYSMRGYVSLLFSMLYMLWVGKSEVFPLAIHSTIYPKVESVTH